MGKFHAYSLAYPLNFFFPHRPNMAMAEDTFEVSELKEDLDDNLLFQLNKSFSEKYDGQVPDFLIRIPGRVNLIGEHVDYCGYSVCPMAIEQCMLAIVKVIDEPKIILSNLESSKYPDYSCRMDDIR